MEKLAKLDNIRTEKEIKMAVGGNNIYILAYGPPEGSQRLLHFRRDEIKELDLIGENSDLKLERPTFITHLAANNKGDVALATNTNTIYYIPMSYGELNFVGKNKKKKNNAHNTPIINLYMTDDHIVSGSAYPTIKMWSIKDGLRNVFEQSHAYLFYYRDGENSNTLFYGDWRLSDRWSFWKHWHRPDQRNLDVVCKQIINTMGIIKSTNTDEIIKYEGAEPIRYPLTITEGAALQLPLCTCKKNLNGFAFQNTPTTVTNYYIAWGEEFKQKGSFNDVPKTLQGLYLMKVVGKIASQLIFVTDKEVRYAEEQHFEQNAQTSFSKLKLITELPPESIIKASAIDSKTLFLILETNHTLTLYKIEIT